MRGRLSERGAAACARGPSEGTRLRGRVRSSTGAAVWTLNTHVARQGHEHEVADLLREAAKVIAAIHRKHCPAATHSVSRDRGNPRRFVEISGYPNREAFGLVDEVTTENRPLAAVWVLLDSLTDVERGELVVLDPLAETPEDDGEAA